MALPKGYIKKYGGLKAAWAAYKKQGKTTPKKARKKSTKRVYRLAKKVTIQTNAIKPAKGTSIMKRKAKHKAKKVYHKAKAMVHSRPGQVIMNAGIATAGGVATSMVLNFIPGVKDMDKGIKSGLQLALGLAGVFLVKNKMVQALSSGVVIAGAFGLSKKYLNLDPLASGGRRMTSAEIRELTSMLPGLSGRMGIPASVRPGSMGIPAQVLSGGSRGFSTTW